MSFRVESNNLWADCRYPLTRSWKELLHEDRSLVHEHSRDVVDLAHVLAVELGFPTILAEMYYESPGCETWHPMIAQTTRTMWDFGGFPSATLPSDELTSLLAHLPLQENEVLSLLAEAMNIGNPVARFLCIWQALAFHVGTDIPGEVETIFFDRIGVPRDHQDRSSSETKYTRFRNMLSHPRGRKVPKYVDLDAQARELADDLAQLVLRDLLQQGTSDS